MHTKLELAWADDSGFNTQRYFFEDGKTLVEEGCCLPPQRSTRYFVVPTGVDDMDRGSKYHWGL